MHHSDTTLHVDQARRMLDFFADAHPFFAESDRFGETAHGGETLNEMAAADH